MPAHTTPLRTNQSRAAYRLLAGGEAGCCGCCRRSDRAADAAGFDTAAVPIPIEAEAPPPPPAPKSGMGRATSVGDGSGAATLRF